VPCTLYPVPCTLYPWLTHLVPGWYFAWHPRCTLCHAAIQALPDDVKKQYEDPASSYNFGWSCGVEALTDGKKDTFKGSFYANPRVDVPPVPPALPVLPDGGSAPDMVSLYPAYYRPNIWPAAHLPQLEGAFKQLGRLIMDVGALLTERCDR
jgi:hypothetical protein